MNESAQLQNLLGQYGKRLNTQLRLENGVCALFTAQKQEAAIIELPPGSDAMILHCYIRELAEDVAADLLRGLLALNFEMDAMRGCWLAFDERQLRLCTQQRVSGLDSRSFTSLLDGFIQQAEEVKLFIAEFITSLTTPLAVRG